MSKKKNTTGKVTVYRLKNRISDLSKAVIDEYDCVASGAESKSELYYSLWMGDTNPYSPSWFEPFKHLVSRGNIPKIKQAGFVLFVNTDSSTYACTGGLGHHKLKDKFSIEHRFGLIVAKKLLAATELKGLVQKDTSGIVNSLDRVFRGTYNADGDIDNLHRILTNIRAGIDKGSDKYHDIGASILAGDSFSVNKSREFEDIFALILKVDELWLSQDAGLEIPELECISRKFDANLFAKLSQKLAQDIRDAYKNGLSLSLFLDNINMGYLPDQVLEYIVIYKRKPMYCVSYRDVFNEVGRILSDPGVGCAELENINIRLKFHDDYISKPKGILYYICGDVELNNDSYFINNGQWFRANEDFIDRVNKELSEIEFIPPSELLLQAWQESGANAENEYNQKHVDTGLVVLDCKTVKIKAERGTVEFCDLLLHKDGDVYLIHVKHACGAKLRVLLAQGYVSAMLFSENDEFKEKVCTANIQRSNNLSDFDKQELAKLNDIQKGQITVVYAIYDDTGSHVPQVDPPVTINDALSGTITLFAKIDLLGRVQAIRAMGFDKVAVTRIMPYPHKKTN